MSLEKEKQIRKYRRWAGQRRSESPIHTDTKINVAIPYLEAALEKERQGTGGVCEDCDEAIPPQRLKLVPGAIRCAECQSNFEASKASK